MSNLLYRLRPIGLVPNAQELADDMLRRVHYGKTVIVTTSPQALKEALHKKWRKLAQEQQDEGMAGYMLRLKFTTHYPPDEYPGSIYFVTAQEALRWPPVCSTMYILCHIERHELYLLTSWMPSASEVIVYGAH